MEVPEKPQAVSDSKPLTTFVQADADTFKDVVQRLTGSSEGTSDSSIRVKRAEFKLHERRQYKAKLEIIKPPSHFQHGGLTVFGGNGKGSPLNTYTPTKCFSGLSLLERGESDNVSVLNAEEEEEKAIKERRFYLHPSPRSKPGFTEPELLSLFPLTSPGKEKESYME